MRTVFKYPIFKDNELVKETARLEVMSRPLSEEPQLLHVGLDPVGRPCIWVQQYDNGNAPFVYNIYIVGTGKEVPLSGTYLGSVVIGALKEIWHIYYERIL